MFNNYSTVFKLYFIINIFYNQAYKIFVKIVFIEFFEYTFC